MAASREPPRTGQDVGVSKGEEGGEEKHKKKARPAHYYYNYCWLEGIRTQREKTYAPGPRERREGHATQPRSLDQTPERL
jgi:hypothetical protein